MPSDHEFSPREPADAEPRRHRGEFFASGGSIKKSREEKGDVGLEEQTKAKRPRKFHVLIHNDDYTTMEFVVQILETIFRKSPSEATQIMLKVHNDGKGIAGTYSRDIAETKVEQVHLNAERNGFPLRATTQAAD